MLNGINAIYKPQIKKTRTPATYSLTEGKENTCDKLTGSAEALQPDAPWEDAEELNFDSEIEQTTKPLPTAMKQNPSLTGTSKHANSPKTHNEGLSLQKPKRPYSLEPTYKPSDMGDDFSYNYLKPISAILTDASKARRKGRETNKTAIYILERALESVEKGNPRFQVEKHLVQSYLCQGMTEKAESLLNRMRSQYAEIKKRKEIHNQLRKIYESKGLPNIAFAHKVFIIALEVNHLRNENNKIETNAEHSAKLYPSHYQMNIEKNRTVGFTPNGIRIIDPAWEQNAKKILSILDKTNFTKKLLKTSNGFQTKTETLSKIYQVYELIYDGTKLSFDSIITKLSLDKAAA